MRISPGTGQLQHPALRSHQLGMILLDQPRQLRGASRRQLLPRIEHTSNLWQATDMNIDKQVSPLLVTHSTNSRRRGPRHALDGCPGRVARGTVLDGAEHPLHAQTVVE